MGGQFFNKDWHSQMNKQVYLLIVFYYEKICEKSKLKREGFILDQGRGQHGWEDKAAGS